MKKMIGFPLAALLWATTAQAQSSNWTPFEGQTVCKYGDPNQARFRITRLDSLQYVAAENRTASIIGSGEVYTTTVRLSTLYPCSAAGSGRPTSAPAPRPTYRPAGPSWFVGQSLDYAGRTITITQVLADGGFIATGNMINFPHPMRFDANGTFLGSTY